VHEHVHEQVVDGAAQQFLVTGCGLAVGDPCLPREHSRSLRLASAAAQQ
jgi:hypothetical protein